MDTRLRRPRAGRWRVIAAGAVLGIAVIGVGLVDAGPLPAGASPSTQLYVSATGSPAGPCSKSRPCKSVGRAVIVANHGGRNMDSAPATIRVLPEIAGKISEPLSKTEKMVIINSGNGPGGGASKLTGDVTPIISQLPPVLESLTGIKFEKLMEQVPALKKAMSKDDDKK